MRGHLNPLHRMREDLDSQAHSLDKKQQENSWHRFSMSLRYYSSWTGLFVTIHGSPTCPYKVWLVSLLPAIPNLLKEFFFLTDSKKEEVQCFIEHIFILLFTWIIYIWLCMYNFRPIIFFSYKTGGYKYILIRQGKTLYSFLWKL